MLPILHTETQKANQTGSAMSVDGKMSWFTQPGSLQAGGQVGAGGLMPRAGRWTWKLAKNVQWHRKTTSTSPSNWMSRETLNLWFCKNCCNQHVTWVQHVTRLHQSKAKLFLCPIQLVNVAWEQKTWRLELSTGRMWETFLAFRCHHPTGSVFHQTKTQFIRGLDTHGTRVNYNQLWCDVVIIVLSLFAHSIQVL